MTQPQQRSEIPPQPVTKLPAAELVIWTTCQIVLLLAVWLDLGISANPGHTAGQPGTQPMLAGQLIMSAAMCASLARSARLAAISFAIAFPVTQLSGWKCHAAAIASLADSAVLLIWLAGLTCWMHLAPGDRAKRLVAAGVMLWIAGTPLLWYILAEFAPGSVALPLIRAISPLMLAGHPLQLLLVIGLPAAVAAGAVAVLRRREPAL
jgi:hypothetical protein